MYNQNSMPPALVKRITILVVAAALFIVALFFIVPWYNVWQQEMAGKAEFAKAEQNRKIKIEEARANLEAEKLNAQAEIERAKGAAEAIRIENGSIKTVIYVPTETNLPILESTRMLFEQNSSAASN